MAVDHGGFKADLIHIVDDQPSILSTLSDVLQDEGYETVCTESGEKALELFRERKPSVVFLDIWLPDRDGLELLQVFREEDPSAAVIMISGHGSTETAVKAIKMGASDYMEKPLTYPTVISAARGAFEKRKKLTTSGALPTLGEDRMPVPEELESIPTLDILQETSTPQRTLKGSTVFYGLGLHSGTRTGMVVQPLPPNSGIHLVTLPTRVCMPVHVNEVADTDYATTLSREGQEIRTVEHLLSALHAFGIGNLLIKVHGEIPVLDGSALEFCDVLEEIGVVNQDQNRKELIIDREYRVGSGDKTLTIEPWDGFKVSYLLRYPPPIGQQYYEFEMGDHRHYTREIAPARTFGFMRDLKMMNELGLGSGGRLDNFILVGEDDVMNTELRFPDEFVRHKILDIIGDLYLLGYPIQGKVTARFTGHRDNIALLRTILRERGH